jgi:inorganic phosphate transporter, PiT family
VSLPLVLVAVSGALIAYINGANDVSKGVATLVGSGVTDYRKAILWGTVCTGLGGLAGAALAGAMVETFGNGLLSSGTVPTFLAALSTILGAAAFVAIATRTGMPVSTTHAIVGSIAGVASVAYGINGIRWAALADKIALPLLLSPIVALVLASLAIRAVWSLRKQPAAAPDCLCAEYVPTVALGVAQCDGTAAAAPSIGHLRFTAATAQACAAERPHAVAITPARLHWISSGATSFARGMNDAPKMVAILLVASMLRGGLPVQPIGFVIIVLGMMAGSWVAGRRVTAVLAEDVTPMDHWEGLLANAVTALLVAPGAALGLPMSTTHVSCGSIIGIGAGKKAAIHWKIVREILLAWVVTVPLAGLLGILIYAALRGLRL